MSGYLGIKELYPTYPLLLSRGRDAKIALGTRKLYVDIPLRIYWLYLLWYQYYNEDDEKLKEELFVYIKELEKELQRELGSYKDIFKITYPIKNRLARRPFLKLLIRWDKFISYLDHKAEKYFEEIMKGNVKITDFYINEILGNYFGIIKFLLGDEERGFKYLLSKMNVRKNYIDIYYKRLLSRIGDLREIKLLINRLINIICVIGNSITNSLIDKVPKEYLVWTNMFMMNLFSDTYGIYNAIARNTNVQEAYLYI